MKFQPSYGADDKFVTVTNLPLDLSFPRSAQVAMRVGKSATLEKAGKGAKGRVATIGFVERDGKAFYAINITGDRPALVTQDMPEWAALTTEDAIKRFTDKYDAILDAIGGGLNRPLAPLPKLIPMDRKAAVAAFVTKAVLPFRNDPYERYQAQFYGSMLPAPTGSYCKPGQPMVTAGFAPDSTNTYSMPALKVGTERVVYVADSEYDTLAAPLRFGVSSKGSAYPCTPAGQAVDANPVGVSVGPNASKGLPTWVNSPWVVLGVGAAAFWAYHHFTRGSEKA